MVNPSPCFWERLFMPILQQIPGPAGPSVPEVAVKPPTSIQRFNRPELSTSSKFLVMQLPRMKDMRGLKIQILLFTITEPINLFLGWFSMIRPQRPTKPCQRRLSKHQANQYVHQMMTLTCRSYVCFFSAFDGLVNPLDTHRQSRITTSVIPTTAKQLVQHIYHLSVWRCVVTAATKDPPPDAWTQ
ncbi:hypothetical protein PTI98_005785 [Pleurotus ostreatus]|nr:hypothetical protein PTI98_005785 [Pleurotus ostreatus]